MIYFILISIIILTMGISIGTPGGIMLLDFIISDRPYIAWYRPLGNMISHILGGVFGYEWGSKMMIAMILLAAGYLGILIARAVSREMGLARGWRQTLVEVVGIFFFVMNPFAYERMLTQPLIYAGVIALGYGIYSMLYTRKYWMAGIAYGIALALFPHASYMIVVIVSLYGIFLVRDKRALRGIVAMVLPIIVLNLNWVMAPYFGVQNTTSITEFSGDNFAAFATHALAPLDVFSTNILLYGFWGEQYSNHFARVYLMSTYWYFAGGIVFFMVLWGGVCLWRSHLQQYLYLMIMLVFLALIFAVGQSSPLIFGLTQWMVEYIPLWQGYREPQKWTGIIMLIEAILFLIAVSALYLRWAQDRIVGGAIFIVIMIVLYIWSPGVLGGYRGQMRTSVYPNGYYQVRDILESSSFSGRILVFPWHAYIGCEWIDRPTIANPISAMYRGLPMIMADTIEVGELLYANNLKNPSRIGIDEFVHIGDPMYLKIENISYIINLRGCTGSEEADRVLLPLLREGYLSIVYQDDMILLYRVID